VITSPRATTSPPKKELCEEQGVLAKAVLQALLMVGCLIDGKNSEDREGSMGNQRIVSRWRIGIPDAIA